MVSVVHTLEPGQQTIRPTFYYFTIYRSNCRNATRFAGALQAGESCARNLNVSGALYTKALAKASLRRQAPSFAVSHFGSLGGTVSAPKSGRLCGLNRINSDMMQDLDFRSLDGEHVCS